MHTQQLQPQRENDRENRLAFQRAHTSISPVAYMLKTAASLSPLLVYEFVKDPQRQRRWARIAIITSAGLQQTLWAMRVRQREREWHERAR